MTASVRPRPWLLELSPSAWATIAALALVFMTGEYGLSNPFPSTGAGVVGALAETCVWTAMAYLAFAAARRWPLYGPGWTRRMPPNLAAWVGLMVLQSILLFVLDREVGGRRAPYWQVLLFYAPGLLIIHMHVLATAHAVYFSRRRRKHAEAEAETQAQLARERLELLRARLRPELVFRALDRIERLARRDAGAADTLLSDLADLLRRALRTESVPAAVPFAQEIAALEDWMAVENALRGHKLRLELDADRAVLRTPVPALLLQPLVETLVHDHAPDPAGPRTVRVLARAEGDAPRLRIEVEIAPGPSPEAAARAEAAVAEHLRRHDGRALELRVAAAPESIRISLSTALP